MKLAGIILAAGLSSRMGRSKPLLVYQGETFLDLMISLLAQVCDPVITVLGHEAEAVQRGTRLREQAVFVVNHEYKRGQLTSLQCGVRSAPANVSHALFTPVDLPAIAPSTVAKIAEACRMHPNTIVRPRVRGKRGHPAALPACLFPQLLTLDPSARTNNFLLAHLGATEFIDVEDENILNDVDLPAEYDALLARTAK